MYAVQASQVRAIGAGVQSRANRSVVCRADGVINKTINKEATKVVTKVSCSDIDGKEVYCRCWKSAEFPKCDGAHMKHNKETGDNCGPIIVSNDTVCMTVD